MAFLAPIVIGMVVGTIVSKIITKITGSEVLGTILGAAAGFGAGAIASGPAAAGGAAGGAEGGASAGAAMDAQINSAGGLDAITGDALASNPAFSVEQTSQILGSSQNAAGLLGSQTPAAVVQQAAGPTPLAFKSAAEGAAINGTSSAAPAANSAVNPAVKPAGTQPPTKVDFFKDPLAWIGSKWDGVGPMGQYGLMNSGGQLVGGLFQGMAAQDKLDREQDIYNRTSHYGVSNDGKNTASVDVAAALRGIRAPTRSDGGAVVQPSNGLLSYTTLNNVSPNTAALQQQVAQLQAENAALRGNK